VVRLLVPRLAVAVAVAVAVLLFVAPLWAAAQQPAGKVPRIGVLMFMRATDAFQTAFREGLRDHGYVEGQNIVVEWRSAEGSVDRANALAAELVRLKVGIIVAEFTPAVRAAKEATRTIPIVMAPAGDPVETGLVASLARPGGNITGISNIAAELSGKRLELLRELVPGLLRVGLLIHGADPLDRAFVDETQRAAANFGIQVHIVGIPRPEDIDAAFSAMTLGRVGAVLVQGNVPVPARQTAELAVRHRLPSISPLNQFAESGGLMSYGPSLTDTNRRAASYVDRILKGAKPAELPVERPTNLELVLNLKTARTIGVTFPQSMLLRANKVIDD
jgi:putative tryptophan/tyrosine transport system substrate-binding protein